MKYHQRNCAIMFCLSMAVVFVCISCGSKPEMPAGGTIHDTYTDKCVIDINPAATNQECKLSQNADDRIVWTNSSTATDGLYVCADPLNDPFEPYGWFVPKGDKRKSGMIAAGLKPANAGTDFYLTESSQACPGPSQILQGIKSVPKIIIVP